MFDAIITFFENIDPILAALLATTFTWLLTAFGASFVFFFVCSFILFLLKWFMIHCDKSIFLCLAAVFSSVKPTVYPKGTDISFDSPFSGDRTPSYVYFRDFPLWSGLDPKYMNFFGRGEKYFENNRIFFKNEDFSEIITIYTRMKEWWVMVL